MALKDVITFLFNKFSVENHFMFGLIFRILLIFYSLIHDEVFELKYTDIDYSVFTDGSRYLWQGRSPFFRFGYRYTPIFAYLTLLNVVAWKALGKLIFSLFDILTGYLIYKTLRERKINLSEYSCKLATLLWIYNPLPLIISTRGSSDSFVTFLILATILLLIKEYYFFSGLVYGLVCHCKLYPVIYAPAFYFYLSGNDAKSILEAKVLWPLNKQKLKFVFTSIISFFLTTYIFYLKFGQLYIEEAWIYHFIRRDYSHNFSPYFYLYQLSSSTIQTKVIGYLAFLPQVMSILHFSVKYTLDSNFKNKYRVQNLIFSLFCTTFLFVSFNKVCTSQYFLWYLALLPLISPYLKFSYDESFNLIKLWLLGQGIWLFFAYLYEYLKLNVLFFVWLSSILFLLINLYILIKIIKAYGIKQIKTI